VTDGWNVRQPRPPAATGPTNGSPWWSDALHDPWRDPYAPAAVVVPTAPASPGPAPEPVANPDAPRRSLAPILLICLVTALLAGGLGGTLGYLFAVKGGVRTGGNALGGAPAESPPAAANRAPDSLAGVAKAVLPSVVTVRVTGAIGSGFVISKEGYVVTNDHVVEGAKSGAMSVVFSDGSTASATLVGADSESDIAVIKVARSTMTPAHLGNSDSIAVGDPVLAFGSPLALVNTVTAGIVSALDRTVQADEGGTTRYYAAIQTDAAVNQGNSGGPLVDAGGKVVGMNSVIRSVGASETQAGNIGLAFAIPINQVKRVSGDIIDTGKARRTVIGAEVANAGASSGAATFGPGATLRSVEPAGPAAAAGLKAGDTITKFDGRVLEDGTDLIALVRKYAPDTTVSVTYLRGSQTRTASVTLAADAK
jgi:putative serine protease PepD